MTGHVLVLNQDYRAISICNVQRAFVLVYLEKADLVVAKNGTQIHTPAAAYPWPSIVRLKRYVVFPYRRVLLSRKNVLRRDAHRCQYCGDRDSLTIDHVLPRSRGGKDAWENLVAACVPCNNKKGSLTPDEAGMSLRRKPFRPSHVMFIRDYVGDLEDEWKPYLFLS